MEEIPWCTLTVLYDYVEYIITAPTNSTIKHLQGEIYKSIGVKVANQEYENEILNEKGIDGKTVGELGLNNDTILYLSEKPNVSKRPGRSLEREMSHYEYYQQFLPLGPYLNNYRNGIIFRQYPRPHKAFLILDEKMMCDSSLFKSPNGEIYVRPHLFRFLRNLYELCDIAIWSTGSLQDLLQVLLKLDLLHHDDFEFVCLLGEESLTTLRIPNVGVVKTKRVSKLWEIYREHNKFTTIICDVDANNYYLNLYSAMLISPYRYEPGQQDDELLYTKIYLRRLIEMHVKFVESEHEE